MLQEIGLLFKKYIIQIHYAVHACFRMVIPYMWPWTTKPVLSPQGIFVAIAKNYISLKIRIFFFYAKNQ